MDIIEGILSEEELRYFDEDGYEAFNKVLDDVLAETLLEYITGTGQDPEVLASVKKHMGRTITNLTFPKTVKDMGVIGMIRMLSIPAIVRGVYSDESLATILTQLQFLENNFDKIHMRSPIRTAKEFRDFESALNRAIISGTAAGAKLNYTNTNALRANSFLFYTPRDTGKSLGLDSLITGHTTWRKYLMCILYKNACDRFGVPAVERRDF